MGGPGGSHNRTNSDTEPWVEGLTIGQVQRLSLDRDELTFNPTDAELLGGRTGEEEQTATLSSNTPWVLTIRGSTAVWDGPWAKPVEDILVGTQSRDAFSVTTSPQELASGDPGVDVAVRMLVSVKVSLEKDRPGTYMYRSLVFQLASQ